MSWVWGGLGISWLSSSGCGDGVPSGISGGGASLIFSGSLVGVNAAVSLWSSSNLGFELNVFGVSWIWSSHGILWLCGSSGGDGVPSGVSGSGACLILGSGLVCVSANVFLWESISFESKLKVNGMTWVWIRHSILWLGSSGSSNGVPSGVSGGGA